MDHIVVAIVDKKTEIYLSKDMTLPKEEIAEALKKLNISVSEVVKSESADL